MQDFVLSGVSFGMGLFKLLLTFLPKRAKFFLKGFGFELAEKADAIAYLRYSITFRGLHGSLSSLLLLSFYSGWVSFISHLPCTSTLEFQEAEKIIPHIRSIYPTGKIWRLLEARILKLKGDFGEAEKIMNGALAEETDSWPEINYLIQYELGW